MDASTLHINFTVPRGWHELSDKQLRYIYELLAMDMTVEMVETLCLLRWSGTLMVGRQPSGSFLLKQGKHLFEVSAMDIAEVLPSVSWLESLPTFPVRLSRIGRARALPADFSGVEFERYIICDNLYQGFLSTKDDALLDELARALYAPSVKPSAAERISVFYWFASLKAYLSARFAEFFAPIPSDTETLGGGSIGSQLQEAMDSQIRALTKGDITKEREILSLDTLRALTELNAQAREYRQMQQTLHK